MKIDFSVDAPERPGSPFIYSAFVDEVADAIKTICEKHGQDFKPYRITVCSDEIHAARVTYGSLPDPSPPFVAMYISTK